MCFSWPTIWSCRTIRSILFIHRKSHRPFSSAWLPTLQARWELHVQSRCSLIVALVYVEGSRHVAVAVVQSCLGLERQEWTISKRETRANSMYCLIIWYYMTCDCCKVSNRKQTGIWGIARPEPSALKGRYGRAAEVNETFLISGGFDWNQRCPQ